MNPTPSNALVLASGNPGKLQELSALLAELGCRLRPQSDFATPHVEETGLSFVENAIIKARAAAGASGLPAIADDSGLEVDILDGAPGIYSARYAVAASAELGPTTDTDRANLEKLLTELEDVPETRRRARFQSVVVYMRHAADPTPVICQGTWEGRIAVAPKGCHGFGYDPIFYLPEFDKTAAELAPEVKNRISHRALAMAQLKQTLTDILGR